MPRRNELAPEVANALVDAYATPAGAVTANPRILRQTARNRQAFERPPVAQGGSGALEYAAGVLAPVPIAGDIAGFANDVNQMRLNPETRTRLNMGLAALGLIPFVPPAVSYGLSRLAQARGVTIAPRPVGPGARQAGVFGGERAKTADLEALASARQMEASGADPRTIWSSTGWFKGVDGNWRFEIDDSQAKFNPSGTGASMRENPLPASDVRGDRGPTVGGLLHHPQLEAAYGQALPRSTFVDNKNVGRGDLEQGSFGAGRLTISAPVSAETGRSVTLHELQHAVQDIEGFAPGGMPAQQNNYAGYRRIPGEVEARAVQARKDMTPEQRRAAFPPDSYDTRPTPILYAPGVSRDTVAENVFSSLPDATLYQLRKSAQEAVARSNDPAAIFRLQKIDEELAQRGPAALGPSLFIPSRLLAAKNKLLTDNRLKKEQNFYGYPDKTSKGILVMMPPQQFLQMAVDGGSDVKRRASQMKQFDVKKYNQEFLPNLTLDRAKGQIVEHEGRARAMRALMDKVTEIPVVISSRGKRFSDIDELPSVVKREHTGEPVSLRDAVPLELLLRQKTAQPTSVGYVDPFRDITR